MPLWNLPQRKSDFTPDMMLQLRPEGSAVLSATEVAGGTARDIAVNANLAYAVVVTSTAYTGYVAGTAEWYVAVEVATSSGGTYQEISRATLPAVGGSVRVGLHSSQSLALNSGHKFIRTRAVKVGTPGNVSYFSYVTHNIAA